MELSNAPDDLLADAYMHLVQVQDDLVSLEAKTGGDETEPVVGEVSEFVARVQAEVRSRDLDERALRDKAREEDARQAD